MEVARIIYYDDRDKLCIISALEIPVVALQSAAYSMGKDFLISIWTVSEGKLAEVVAKLGKHGVILGSEANMTPLDESVLEGLQSEGLVNKIVITDDMIPILQEMIPDEDTFEPRLESESFFQALSRKTDGFDSSIESLEDRLDSAIGQVNSSGKQGLLDALKGVLGGDSSLAGLKINTKDGSIEGISGSGKAGRDAFRKKGGSSVTTVKEASKEVSKLASQISTLCLPEDGKDFERITMTEALKHLLKDNPVQLKTVSDLLPEAEVIEIPEVSVGGDKKGSEISA